MTRLLASISLFCLLVFTGCQSGNQPGSGSHAAVQINGRSLAEIQATTTAVFGQNGYSSRSYSSDLLVFERPGTSKDIAKYGGWMSEDVTMCVKVGFRQQVGGAWLVQADAYYVQNSGNPNFRNESRTMTMNRAPYQRMLDEVAKRLQN